MSYTQLTEVERYQIEAFLKAGFTQKSIAEELGRDPGTISREVSIRPMTLFPPFSNHEMIPPHHGKTV